jgi:hypothetical protein
MGEVFSAGFSTEQKIWVALGAMAKSLGKPGRRRQS